MRKRLMTYGAVLAALLIVVVVGLVAYQALRAPDTAATSSAPVALNCSPSPCADVQGYTLWISNAHVMGNVVAMTVRYKNSSGSTHASPEDLALTDANNRTAQLYAGAPGCSTFGRHEFNHGATFGPIDVCFRFDSAAPPYALIWSPDMGLLCCQADIRIPT